jgi:uncharacterized protein YggE
MRTSCILLILLSLATVASPQVSTAPPQTNTIYAGAEGKFEAPPDTAVLQFNLSSQQDTARAAYDKVSAGAEHVRQVLKSNGLDSKAMQVGSYSVQPVYDWKNPKHKVVGFRVTTSITLKLRDFSKVGPMIEQTADIEEAESQSLNYILEDIDQAKSKAAEDALKRARIQASAVAAAGGRSLGELLYASVDVSQPIIPVPMMQRAAVSAAGAAAPAPMAEFTPQTVNVNAHVNALFALK